MTLFVAGRQIARVLITTLVLTSVGVVSVPLPAHAQARAESELGRPVSDDEIRTFFLLDQLDTRFTTSGADSVKFNGLAWIGGDYNRIWLKPEGTKVFGGPWEDVDVQLLYGRLITPFWDFQTGLRYSQPSSRGPARGSAVLGVQGIAPYWFDVEAALFVSHLGEVSARVELEYDLLLTQRLILQPRLETNLGAQNVRELGMNAGVTDIELGARLRYEIRREFAPYVGVVWSRRFGEAASAARREGGDPDVVNFVVGVRLWF